MTGFALKTQTLRRGQPLAAAAALVALISSVAVGDTPCDRITQEVNAMVRTQYQVDSEATLRSLLAGHATKSLDQLEALAADGRLAAAALLKLVTAGLESEITRPQKEQRLSQLKSFFGQVPQKSDSSFANLYMNGDVVAHDPAERWLTCIMEHRDGLHGRLTSQGSTAKLELLYRHPQDDTGSDVAVVQVLTHENCEFVAAGEQDVLKHGDMLKHGVPLQRLLKKTNPARLSSIVVKTDRGVFCTLF